MRNCSCQGNHHNFSFKLKIFFFYFPLWHPLCLDINILLMIISSSMAPTTHCSCPPENWGLCSSFKQSTMFYVIFRLHSSYNKVKLFKLDCVVFRGQEVVLVSNPVEVLAQLGVDDVLVSAAHSARLVGHQAHGRPTSEILVLSQQCSTRVSLQQSASN